MTNWNRKNEGFRYVAEERMITERERRHIEAILSHPVKTDVDFRAINELVENEAPETGRKDHGLRA